MSRIVHKRQYPDFVPNNWTECYKLPLHSDDEYCMYAWDADEHTVLDFYDSLCDETEDFTYGDRERINHILDIINGECPTDYEAKWTTGDDVTEIYYDGKFQFLVRGWGHLTGCGGLNLPEDLAAKIQDEFIAYILGKLNGSNGVK